MPFQVFLSHKSADKEIARELKRRLERFELTVWFDEDQLRPGMPWQELLELGIRQSSSIAVLVGKDGLGPWEDEEMQGALRLAAKDKRPVIPVLLPNAPSLPELPMFLGNRTWVDLRGELSDETISTLVWGITGNKQDPLPEVAPDCEQPEGTISIKSDMPTSLNSNSTKLVTDTQIDTDYQQFQQKRSVGGGLYFIKNNAPLRFHSWLNLAENGNPIAQYFVGMCFYDGVMFDQDYTAAHMWLHKSAEQGINEAMHIIGYAYDCGEGVERSQTEAIRWYSKAAEHGNSISMNNLGVLFRDGINGGKPNFEIALHWFRKAADAGDAIAMRNIGNYYAWGSGGVADHKEAEKWYDDAVKNGDTYTQGLRLAKKVVLVFREFMATYNHKSLHAVTLKKVDPLINECLTLDLVGVNALFGAYELKTVVTEIKNATQCETLVTYYNKMVDHYLHLFENGMYFERISSLNDFCTATDDLITQWERESDHDRITGFWRANYADLKLEELIDCEESLIRHLKMCISSLLKTGHRLEAKKLLDSTLSLCDRTLSERPWEWYVKDNYTGLCFDTAKTFNEQGSFDEVQPLLQRAWASYFKLYAKEEIEGRYPILPLKGNEPIEASEEDMIFFQRFITVEGDNGESKNKLGMKVFTVSCDFAGVEAPFDVYIIDGKNAYTDILDQIRWLKERRGGIFPQDARDSFLSLYEVAIRNNVSYPELCSYALKEANKNEVLDS